MTTSLLRGVWPLIAAAMLARGGAAWAADADSAPTDLPPPAKIRDLDYGDVLFHFFQDDYFAALVRLEVARPLGRVPDHATEAELLAGGLYLSLGMSGEAKRRFETLLAGRQVPQSVSDRAYFYLARIAFQRGDPRDAWQSLGRIRGILPGQLEPERRLLAANTLMALGRFQDAVASLDAWQDDSIWAEYARFTWASRWCVRVIPRAGANCSPGSAPWTPAARNGRHCGTAPTSLGFALLQERQADAAAAALRHVRLDGPFTTARCSVSAGQKPTPPVRSRPSHRGSNCASGQSSTRRCRSRSSRCPTRTRAWPPTARPPSSTTRGVGLCRRVATH